jgi:hypothetical protein
MQREQAVQDEFRAATVGRIGEARGATPDLHTLDLGDSSWAEKAFEISASQQCGNILPYPHHH